MPLRCFASRDAHILVICSALASCVALGLRSRLDSRLLLQAQFYLPRPWGRTDSFGFGFLRRSTAYFHIGVPVIVPPTSM